jgi:hypothetical protein
MKPIKPTLLSLACLALASCAIPDALKSGVSGGVYLTSEEYGAKAGLEYEDGEGRAFARKDFRDPVTGELLARTEIEKRFGTEPEILGDK